MLLLHGLQSSKFFIYLLTLKNKKLELLNYYERGFCFVVLTIVVGDDKTAPLLFLGSVLFALDFVSKFWQSKSNML